MMLHEAIRSGKRFRRPGQEWFWVNDAFLVVCRFGNSVKHADNLIADDWEIEPDGITVTREQVDIALMRYEASKHNTGFYAVDPGTRHETFLKELGFK